MGTRLVVAVKLTTFAVLCMAYSSDVSAQQFYYSYGAVPVVTHRVAVVPAPVVSTYRVPVAVPYPAPVVRYSVAPVPVAPPVSYYAPRPVVVARPALVRPKYYVAGQPVRNAVRAVTP